MLKRISQIHRWLGVLFAPLIIYFACTGVLMTFQWHESTKDGSYRAPKWLVTLSHVHKDQRLARAPGAPSPLPLKWFVACMGVGLVFTALLGIWMAFKYQRNAWVIVGLLALGAALPAVLLFL
jgi:hypothetical protein